VRGDRARFFFLPFCDGARFSPDDGGSGCGVLNEGPLIRIVMQ
jgi:hypothetical protein